MISKTDLLTLLKKETETTLRVMRAFPEDKGNFTPHEKSSDATKLMKTFVFEMYLNAGYLFGDAVDPAKFQTYAPESIPALIADFEKEANDCIARLEALPEEQLAETVEFANKTFDKDKFALMMICDQIHHRGQLTVYVRMAGGSVPSIYGPSADDTSTNL